jgi:NADH-quinone oxidoreductase subunit N
LSAPVIWLGIPVGAAVLLWAITSERWTAILGGGLALSLSVLAAIIPIDRAILIGSISIRVASTFELLGRRFILSSSDQVILVLIYGIISFWFFGSAVAKIAHRLVPLGLIITALLIGSLAVEPFLYAALLIEMAVLIAVPLLVPPDKKPGRGVIRFLIFQTLAMPFILFSGFLLSGVEASPADIGLVIQAAVLLSLGFAFLLAVFPFFTWIPMICQEAPPYAVGFILMIFPTIGVLFGLSFLDRYSFLREAGELYVILRFIAILTLVVAGLWAMFQHHAGRIMGYAAVIATSMSILAISLPDAATAVGIVFILIIPRAMGLGVWSLALTILDQHSRSLEFSELNGQARHLPLISVAIIGATLSMAGVVPFIGFPIQFSLWDKVGEISVSLGIWFGIGILGLTISAFRTLAALFKAPETTPWHSTESWPERIYLGIGLGAIIMFGLFPQWTQLLLVNLPTVFERLGK